MEEEDKNEDYQASFPPLNEEPEQVYNINNIS
jgi:hypothetical protein